MQDAPDETAMYFPQYMF